MSTTTTTMTQLTSFNSFQTKTENRQAEQINHSTYCRSLDTKCAHGPMSAGGMSGKRKFRHFYAFNVCMKKEKKTVTCHTVKLSNADAKAEKRQFENDLGLCVTLACMRVYVCMRVCVVLLLLLFHFIFL